MPEYIFAAMLFFCQINAVEVVALRSCRPSVTNAGVRLNKLATRGRRIVRRRRCQRRTGDALQTAAGRTPVWWKLRRRQVRTKRGNREASSPLDSWLDFCSLTCANLLSFCAPLLIVKRKKLPWVPIKIEYFKRRALPGGQGSIKRWPYERRKEGIKCVCAHQVKPVVPFF